MKNYNIDKVNGITAIQFSQVPTIDEAKGVIDRLVVKSDLFENDISDAKKFVLNINCDDDRDITVGCLKTTKQ